MTATLHRTTKFRVQVDRVGTKLITLSDGKSQGPGQTKIGSIPLGLQHAGVATLRFHLALGGYPLGTGNYTLYLQALTASGTVKSQSLPVFLYVRGNQASGRITSLPKH